MELSLDKLKRHLPANHGHSDLFLQEILSDASRIVSEIDNIPISHNLFDYLQRLKCLALLQLDFATRKGFNSVETTPADSPTSFSLAGAFSVGLGGAKSESEKIYGSQATEVNSFEVQYKIDLAKIRGLGGRTIA
ncbi:hypothetical protein ACLK29_04700 [Leptospira kirschneri]|uniref:hypothetical protein n=1 Tax=Leptospira kirschneri TaxID=29507 RepID=UPI00046C7CE0|nr:hypothetical protein [Leptospira kirschneri]